MHIGGAGLFVRVWYCGSMRRFTFLNLCLLLAGVTVIGGALMIARYYPAHGEELSADEELPNVYTHPELGFSFRYPAAFRVNEMPHGNGSETVLVEDPLHARQGFQVFTQPYDDAGPLTEPASGRISRT
jgi:hypothetical protein